MSARVPAGVKRRRFGENDLELLLSRRREAIRLLYGGSATLATSVLLDSTIEHYRGGFYNQVMFVAPTLAGLTLAKGMAALASSRAGAGSEPLYGAAVIAGLVGSGFHAWNITRRVGGWRWMNLLYGAPLAAPLGLTFAGILGLAATSLSRQPAGAEPGPVPGRLLAAISAAGLLGTAAEAGLLHFRGAFHDPFMFLPVTVPPLAAAVLVAATLCPRSPAAPAALALLRATRVLGFAGVGFHALGVQRNMGGWCNWSQNLLQGPPLPAPPSFTGMALAGQAALLMQTPSAGLHGVRSAVATKRSNMPRPATEGGSRS